MSLHQGLTRASADVKKITLGWGYDVLLHGGEHGYGLLTL